MTITTDQLDAPARVLRARFRDRLEKEYRHLHEIDRTGLPEAEHQLIDRQITLIHDQLGFLPHPHVGSRICCGSCAMIDAGTGPRAVLIVGLDVPDDDLICIDSALGRALVGAEAGERIRFQAADGPRTVHVIAVES